MNSISNLYLPMQTINCPQDNDVNVIFDFMDEDGELLDLSGVVEIDFVVFDSVGGDAEIELTYTGGDITIHGNNYQFSVPISGASVSTLTNRLSYYECRVEDASNSKRTVSAGLFRAEKTYIWSIT